MVNFCYVLLRKFRGGRGGRGSHQLLCYVTTEDFFKNLISANSRKRTLEIYFLILNYIIMSSLKFEFHST